MRVAVLGPLRFRVADHDVVIRGRQALLIAALALRSGRRTTASALSELLWPQSPANAHAAVHVVVSRARAALARQLGARDARQLLRTTDDGYVLDIAAEHVDARELVRLTAAARAALDDQKLPIAIDAASAAMSLVRGDPLTEVTAAGLDWPEVHELLHAVRRAMEVWAETHLAAGREDVVEPVLRQHLRRWPGDERIVELAMIALHREGLVDEAERVFDRCRVALADDFDVLPGPRLLECRRRLIAATIVVGADLTTALRAAADFALNAGGYHRAIDGYRALLASQHRLAGREAAEVLAGLGEALYHQYGTGEWELEAATSRFLTLDALDDAAHALAVLARARWLAGDARDASKLVRRVGGLLGDTPKSRSAAAALAHVAGLLGVNGRSTDAAMTASRAMRLADRHGDSMTYARAMANMGLAHVLAGELESGERELTAAMELRRAHGAPPSTPALVTLADAHARMGKLQSARRLLAEAATIARTLNRDADLRWQDGERLTYLFWAGRWVELRRAAGEFEATVGFGHRMSYNAALTRARLLTLRGDRAAAKVHARESYTLARDTGDPGATLASLAMRGSLELARSRLLPIADEALHLMSGSSLDASAGAALGLTLRTAGVRARDVVRRGVAPSPWRDALLLVLAGDVPAARQRYVTLSSRGDVALLG